MGCSRDADSRPSIREAAAVHVWEMSKTHIHILRDHPGHVGYPILAGMWCARTTFAAPYFRELLGDEMAYHSFRGAEWFDQELLKKYIAPRLGKQLTYLAHRSFGCAEYPYPSGLPFPLPRVGLEHVGMAYMTGSEHSSLREHSDLLNTAINNNEECFI